MDFEPRKNFEKSCWLPKKWFKIKIYHNYITVNSLLFHSEIIITFHIWEAGHMAHLDGREASLVTVHTVSKASHDQNGAILRVFKKVVVSKSHPVSNYDPTYSLTLSSDNPDIPEESFCAMVTSPIYKMVVSAKSMFLPYTSHLFQSSFFSPSLPQSVQDYISGSKWSRMRVWS